MTTILRRGDLVWRGLALHRGRRKTPVLTLVRDDTYPHLYRIRYPDGWVSAPANLTRAHAAAHGHARDLLTQETATEAPHSPESSAPVPDTAEARP